MCSKFLIWVAIAICLTILISFYDFKLFHLKLSQLFNPRHQHLNKKMNSSNFVKESTMNTTSNLNRLIEQLEKKDQAIARLKHEVKLRDEVLKKA